MHGQGTITEPNGKKSEATYYYDLEIKLSDQNPDCYNHFYLNIILVILTIGLFYGMA
jgi:hypothetical protein